MSYERVVEMGAEVIGGVAYIEHKEVGRWSAGQFHLTPHGEAVIASAEGADAVEVSAPPTPVAPPATPKRTTKAATVVAPVPAVPPTVPVPDPALTATAPASPPVAPPPLPKPLQAEAEEADKLLAQLAALGQQPQNAG
jgi:hypothetical protein